MFVMDYKALCHLVADSLPGRTKWMQCIPVAGDGAPTEQGVGLAITAEHGPDSYWYDVIYFSVVPNPDATGADGDFLPGRGEEGRDWTVQLGYEEDFDTIGEAVEEAKILARNLPQAGIFPSRERFEAALDMLDETDERQALAGAWKPPRGRRHASAPFFVLEAQHCMHVSRRLGCLTNTRDGDK